MAKIRIVSLHDCPFKKAKNSPLTDRDLSTKDDCTTKKFKDFKMRIHNQMILSAYPN
jgi:hypothetical protein